MEWQGISCVPASVCLLRSKGRDSGLVIDIGASGFRVNAVRANRVVASTKGDVGGNLIEKHEGPEWWKKGTVPEILFKPPSGLKQSGLAGAVAHVLGECAGLDYVLLAGGISALPGLQQKLTAELSSLGKSLNSFKVDISSSRNAAFTGACQILEGNAFDTAVPDDFQNLDLPL